VRPWPSLMRICCVLQSPSLGKAGPRPFSLGACLMCLRVKRLECLDEQLLGLSSGDVPTVHELLIPLV
jgi:hypothetical protein